MSVPPRLALLCDPAGGITRQWVGYIAVVFPPRLALLYDPAGGITRLWVGCIAVVFHTRLALLCDPAGGITRLWVGCIAVVFSYFVDLVFRLVIDVCIVFSYLFLCIKLFWGDIY